MAAISGSLATTSLLAALHKIEEQSDVTMEEARWLRQQVVRLIAEHETQTESGPVTWVRLAPKIGPATHE